MQHKNHHNRSLQQQPLHPAHLYHSQQAHPSCEQQTAATPQQDHPGAQAFPQPVAPQEPVFRIKFKPSLFSKYEKCTIKPLPLRKARPQVNQQRPQAPRQENHSAKVLQETNGDVGRVFSDHYSNLPLRANLRATSVKTGHREQQKGEQASSNARNHPRSSAVLHNSHAHHEQNSNRTHAQTETDWTVSKQPRTNLGRSVPGHKGMSTLQVPPGTGAGTGGGAGGRARQGRGSPADRRRSSVRKRKSSTGSAFKTLDENEILQMYEEDGELADRGEDEEAPLTLVERIGEQKDIMENVKFQPWPIRKKLQVLKLAKSFVMKHEGQLSRGRGYQQKGRQLLKQLKRSWNNLEYWITPWEMRIKRIESHFGSVVTSYFIFLRWLLWINVWLTLMPLCFVIVPEMLVGPDHGTTERKTIPDDEYYKAFDLKTIWAAEGVMRYSPLFYGYYGNAHVIGNGFRLPLAYLMTTLVSFVYSFIVVLKKMASNSRQSRMSNKDEQFTFSWKLYTDWDYMVGNQETANTKHASIVTTMKEAIVEEQEKKQEEKNYLLVFLRVLANVIIVILLALSGYIIQLFVERSREMELLQENDKDLDPGFWAENELTIIMTLISTLFPNVLDLISLMEKYHPRTSLRLTLARIFLLNLINLYTLFIALYNKQNDLKGREITSVSGCFSSLTNVSDVTSNPLSTTTLLTTFTTTMNNSNITVNNNSSCSTNSTSTPVTFCWETMIGQEVFKLTLMDLIFTMGQIFIIDVLRSVFIKYANNICCWDLQKQFPEYPDFKTAENLLHLINNQGVIWLGAFFSPGLTVLNLLKLLLLMYVRCWTVMVCNVPQERIFRASRSNNFYLALLLVMLFLCMLPPLFAIVGIEPSPTCGPFSGLAQIYHVLTRTMETELPANVNSVLDYAASPGVILPIFMLLGMTIYYLVSVGRSLREANNELRMMLEYERTEGRKKVYAMADAKRGLEKPDGNKANPTNTKMVSAVSSVLKAAQMAKAIGGLAMDQKRKAQSNTSGGGGGGQKVAPAVQPKPHVPVAVVQGKRSLKRSMAAVLNKAQAARRLQPTQQQRQNQHQPQPEQQPQQQQRGRPKRVAITNGHMTVATSSSVDTPEASSNDEDDSSCSSGPSPRPQDEPSHMVDASGHLRPVSEDDVILDMDSDGEGGYQMGYNDRRGYTEDTNRSRRYIEDYEGRGYSEPYDNDDVFVDSQVRPGARQGRNEPSAAGNRRETNQQQQTTTKNTTARPPVRPKPARVSRKIQPSEIPEITVVDFGQRQGGSANDNRNEAALVSAKSHVEPHVIMANENAKNKGPRRLNKLGAAMLSHLKANPDAVPSEDSSEAMNNEGRSGNYQTQDRSRRNERPDPNILSRLSADHVVSANDSHFVERNEDGWQRPNRNAGPNSNRMSRLATDDDGRVDESHFDGVNGGGWHDNQTYDRANPERMSNLTADYEGRDRTAHVGVVNRDGWHGTERDNRHVGPSSNRMSNPTADYGGTNNEAHFGVRNSDGWHGNRTYDRDNRHVGQSPNRMSNVTAADYDGRGNEGHVGVRNSDGWHGNQTYDRDNCHVGPSSNRMSNPTADYEGRDNEARVGVRNSDGWHGADRDNRQVGPSSNRMSNLTGDYDDSVNVSHFGVMNSDGWHGDDWQGNQARPQPGHERGQSPNRGQEKRLGLPPKKQARARFADEGAEEQTSRDNSSASKFSNILARFQHMDDND